jgi:hypothetical protein
MSFNGLEIIFPKTESTRKSHGRVFSAKFCLRVPCQRLRFPLRLSQRENNFSLDLVNAEIL